MKQQTTLNLLHTIGKQIRHHRRRMSMSQLELAAKVGIFRTYLSRIENGRANPSIAVISNIAVQLNVDFQALLIEIVDLPVDFSVNLSQFAVEF